jgi:isopenicillin N synthase-like dioxygenase
VEVLKTGVREKGFFYVKNFKIEQDLVSRQFALGREFYELPLEEKQKYTPEGLGAWRPVGRAASVG